MSAMHSCSPSLSPSLSHLFSLSYHRFLSIFHLCPQLNSFFFTYPSFYSLSLLSYFKSCFQSVNQSPPPFSHLLICLLCQPASPHSSPMATCHCVNLSFRLYITVFITSRHPPSLSFFLMRQSSSFPLSLSLFQIWESISVHY